MTHARVSMFLATAIFALPLAGQTRTERTVLARREDSLAKATDRHADLSGVWSNATIIPLERSKELGDKRTFSEAEYAEYEKRVFQRSDRDRPNQAGVGTYNNFWWDPNQKLTHNLNTSLIIDPPDGHVPALTPAAAKTAEEEREWSRLHPADGPEDRPLIERCMVFPTAGPPMLPSFYNGTPYGPLETNYRIVQNRDFVEIYIDHNHERRIIPLDGRPHLPPTVRQWFGDPRGHWEGDTLVVDSTNFTNMTKFRGADENLHLIERFRRTGPDTLMYTFTIDDPTAFTRPWTGEYPFRASDDAMYEYACHEGNYGMAGVLSGARAAEKNSSQH